MEAPEWKIIDTRPAWCSGSADGLIATVHIPNNVQIHEWDLYKLQAKLSREAECPVFLELDRDGIAISVH